VAAKGSDGALAGDCQTNRPRVSGSGAGEVTHPTSGGKSSAATLIAPQFLRPCTVLDGLLVFRALRGWEAQGFRYTCSTVSIPPSRLFLPLLSRLLIFLRWVRLTREDSYEVSGNRDGAPGASVPLLRGFVDRFDPLE